jgi:hypothetical protein
MEYVCIHVWLKEKEIGDSVMQIPRKLRLGSVIHKYKSEHKIISVLSNVIFLFYLSYKCIHIVIMKLENKLAQAVTILTRLQEVLGSNLGRDIGYFDCDFCGFSQSFH